MCFFLYSSIFVNIKHKCITNDRNVHLSMSRLNEATSFLKMCINVHIFYSQKRVILFLVYNNLHCSKTKTQTTATHIQK